MININRLEKCIVRFLNSRGEAIGVGFLSSERIVITCAHVVIDVQKNKHDVTAFKNREISVDFPLISGGQILKARVMQCFFSDNVDIAVLELIDTPPTHGEIAHITSADNIRGHQVCVYGFPPGHNDGVWAYGKITGRTAKGWFQVEDIKEPGYRIQPGFSGGPVWDDQLGGVVGIIVAAERRPEAKAAFILPVGMVLDNYPELAEWIKPVQIIESIQRAAINCLNDQDYKGSYRICEDTLKSEHSHPELNLIAAISLMKGRSADRLPLSKVLRIEKHLKKALEHEGTEALALAVLGIVKYDFYVINGLHETKPTFQEIVDRLRATDVNSIDKSLLNHVNSSEGARQNLGLSY